MVVQDGWPDIIAKEVTDNLHKFIANIYVTIGQTKGKTLLALPPTDVSAAPTAPSLPIHALLHERAAAYSSLAAESRPIL